MKLTYCKHWSEMLATPIKIMPEARARRIHEQNKNYEVVIEDDAGVPSIVVAAALRTRCYGVQFLDDQRRYRRNHTWADDGNGRLFLESIGERLYLADGVGAKFDVNFMYFDQDGSVWQPYSDAFGWQRRDLYRGLDVSDHYEPWPEFGHYERLLRRERSVPPGFGL